MILGTAIWWAMTLWGETANRVSASARLRSTGTSKRGNNVERISDKSTQLVSTDCSWFIYSRISSRFLASTSSGRFDGSSAASFTRFCIRSWVSIIFFYNLKHYKVSPSKSSTENARTTQPVDNIKWLRYHRYSYRNLTDRQGYKSTAGRNRKWISHNTHRKHTNRCTWEDKRRKSHTKNGSTLNAFANPPRGHKLCRGLYNTVKNSLTARNPIKNHTSHLSHSCNYLLSGANAGSLWHYSSRVCTMGAHSRASVVLGNISIYSDLVWIRMYWSVVEIWIYKICILRDLVNQYSYF